jgi:hypothetical protein
MTNLYLFTENLPEKNSSNPKLGGMLKFAAILNQRSSEVVKKKNISKPYQFFGVWIAQNLNEYENIPVYIKLAKYQDRNLLEQAVGYVRDYPDAKSKHNLFMWYLKGKLKPMPKKAKAIKQKKLF